MRLGTATRSTEYFVAAGALFIVSSHKVSLAILQPSSGTLMVSLPAALAAVNQSIARACKMLEKQSGKDSRGHGSECTAARPHFLS